MKAKLECVSSIKQKVVVSITAEELKKSRHELYNVLKHEVTVKGFRKGKSPEALIIQEMGDASYKNRLVRQIVKDTYPDAIEQVSGKPISDPEVDVEKAPLEGDFSYEAAFEVVPEEKAKDYKKISLVKNEINVGNADVEEELAKMQRQLMQLEPAPEGIIDSEHMAVVEYKGTADGKTFKGCESDNFIVETDSKALLPEFIKKVSGMKIGEERTVNFVYPKDYFNKEVAGKNGEFFVKVKDIRKKHLPPIDDAFTKNFGKFDSLSAFKKDLKTRMQASLKYNEQTRLEKSAAIEVANKNKFEVPAAMISFHLSQMLEELSSRLSQQGKTLDDAKLDTDVFVKENYDEALLRAKWYILSESIAVQEKLEATQKEIDERITLLAQMQKKPEHEVRPKEGGSEWHSLCRSIRSSLALKFVLDSSKTKVLPKDPDKVLDKKEGKEKTTTAPKKKSTAKPKKGARK